MGFGGAAQAMINSLKNNSRRKKRTHFDKNKASGYHIRTKSEYDFPEATPKVLEQIRLKLKKGERTTSHQTSYSHGCIDNDYRFFNLFFN